jgi:hypothetical protein
MVSMSTYWFSKRFSKE